MSATGAAATPSVTFGLFADPHYADKPVWADRHYRDSLAKLQVAVETFNAHRLDLAFNLGDTLDTSPDMTAERQCLAAMRDAGAGFRGALHVVLGNHDLAEFTKPDYLRGIGALIPAPYYSFDHGGFHFAVLDGNCHEDGSDFAAGNFDWANAWVSAPQIRWLAKDLADSAPRPAIVLCHEDLDARWDGAVLDPHVARNAAAVRAAIERAGNVRAVIQGHYHPGLCTVQNGVPYVTTAAMVCGPGLESNAYAIVEVAANGAVTLTGFGRQKSWTWSP